jgi:hypothetical protein
MNTDQFFSLLTKIKTQSDYIRYNFNLESFKLLVNELTYHRLLTYCGKPENYFLSSACEFQSDKTILGMRVLVDEKLDDDEVEVVFPIRELLK